MHADACIIRGPCGSLLQFMKRLMARPVDRMTRRAARLDRRLLARLRRVLDQPPSRPRWPLELRCLCRAAACIGSIEPMLAQRMADAGLPLRAIGSAWCIEIADAAAIDPTLGVFARWLHAHRLASPWRDEILAVTDARGRPVAAIERAAVRALGIASHAMHLMVSDERGQMWVQQRAFDKATDPGQWDTTVGGLITAGESALPALAREAWEEAGLRIDDLQALAPLGRMTARRPVAEGYRVEHIDVFEAAAPVGMALANQHGEVEQFECLAAEALVERLHADAFTREAGLMLATWLMASRT